MVDPEIARTLGKLEQAVSSLPRMSEQMNELHKSMAEQRSDYVELSAGLKKANDDLRTLREDVQVQSDHIKSLNGTDSKLKALGIDIDKSDEWRDVFLATKRSHETRGVVFRRVVGAVAVAGVMALGGILWKGVEAWQQEEVKANVQSIQNHSTRDGNKAGS